MIQQTITTYWVAATNKFPRRIIAKTSGGLKITRSEESDSIANDIHVHAKVANELRLMLGWTDMVEGGATGKGFIWVFPAAADSVRLDVMTPSA